MQIAFLTGGGGGSDIKGVHGTGGTPTMLHRNIMESTNLDPLSPEKALTCIWTFSETPSILSKSMKLPVSALVFMSM